MWNVCAPSKWPSDGQSGSWTDCCLQTLSRNGRRVLERERMRGSFRFLCGWFCEGDGETAYSETKSATHHGRIDRDWSAYKVGSRCGGGDVVYMQITLTDQVETDPEVDKFVNNGPPCFLIHVVHLWWILWWIQTSCWAAFQASVHDSWSHSHSSCWGSNAVVGTGQGMACLRQWVHHEIMFRPLLLISY